MSTQKGVEVREAPGGRDKPLPTARASAVEHGFHGRRPPGAANPPGTRYQDLVIDDMICFASEDILGDP